MQNISKHFVIFVILSFCHISLDMFLFQRLNFHQYLSSLLYLYIQIYFCADFILLNLTVLAIHLTAHF